jgi:hypothetical protein
VSETAFQQLINCEEQAACPSEHIDRVLVLVLASMLFRPAETAHVAASALSVASVLAAYAWQRRAR